MSDEAELQAWRDAINKIDLLPLLRRLMYGGFDSYADYEKYGDAFVPLKMPIRRVNEPKLLTDQREKP